ncbi:MAG: hypothetical protein AABY07_01830 [Nanoarchaeota archaeon]
MNKSAKFASILSIIVLIFVLAIIVLAAPKKCNNNLDDDNDGLVDYPADPGCSGLSDNTETSTSLVCDNGLDQSNDADTLADFRLTNGDPGCTSATDSSEIDGQCDDLLDNDGDTHIDYGLSNGKDSKCTSFSDNDESPRDNCSDSDGFNQGVQGTVSGDDESIPYSLTDFCVSTTVLKEYHCGSLLTDYAPLNTDVNCNVTCSNGAC